MNDRENYDFTGLAFMFMFDFLGPFVLLGMLIGWIAMLIDKFNNPPKIQQ
ncbi:MAG: hypothetical protein N3D16_10340 [Anaerolineales bacterium]|nr:hypothetical protein [Anaerolineales bacterium]